MPRYPNPSTDNISPPSVPPTPVKSIYDYRLLNPEDAETRKYPYNGETVMVSDDTEAPGFAAKWRSTRQLKGWKWVKTGAWVIPLYNTSLHFDPLCWRPLSNLEDLEN